MSAPPYSIANEVIARHEAAILAEPPRLYPDEGKRSIIEHVFMP